MSFTKQDLLNVEARRSKIESERSKLVFQKKELENEMQVLKNKVRTKQILPQKVYQEICDQQEETKRKILKIERVIFDKNDELRKMQITLDNVKLYVVPDFDFSELKNNIQHLKNKYELFSSDKTRIPAMRKITEEFTVELQQVINYIDQVKANLK